MSPLLSQSPPSPSSFVLGVYLTLGQQNTFPTQILENGGELPLSKEAIPTYPVCRGSWGTTAGLSPELAAGGEGSGTGECRADGDQASPSCLQALQEVGGPLKQGVSHLLLFILFAAGKAENLINCMKPKEA